MTETTSIALSAGTVEYIDTGGPGRALVFMHGLLMDHTVWRKVVAQLGTHYRCVVPTLPLGGHRIPMNPDADLTLFGIAGLVSEFIAALKLDNVVLVQNDWGGAQIMIANDQIERVGALILTSCEAFTTYPPLPARIFVLAAAIPGGLRLAMTILNTRLGRRGPGTWGWMSKRPIPTEIIDAWFAPATTSAEIRRDLKKYLRSVPSRRRLTELASRSAEFDRPVLVAWAKDDRMFPITLGRRLAETFPDSAFVAIDDSYTLIPEDQPDVLSEKINDFVRRLGRH